MYPLGRFLPVGILSPDRHPPVSSDEVCLYGRVVIHQGQEWPDLRSFQLHFRSWDSTLQTVSGHDQLETTRIGHSEKPKVLGATSSE